MTRHFLGRLATFCMQSGLRFQPHQADSLGHRNQTFPAQGSRQRCDQHRHDTTGLHFASIDLLPKVLHRLQGAGTTTVATNRRTRRAAPGSVCGRTCPEKYEGNRPSAHMQHALTAIKNRADRVSATQWSRPCTGQAFADGTPPSRPLRAQHAGAAPAQPGRWG